MNFREFINEDYVINDDKTIVDKLSKQIFVLNHIHNDFKYLHLNSNGPTFEIIHNKFNDYYYTLSENIDYLCEVVASYNTKELECCPINFNDSPDLGKHVGSDVLGSNNSLVQSGLNLLKLLLGSFEKCRKCIKNNDAIISRLDDFASYWQKEYTYLLKRFENV